MNVIEVIGHTDEQPLVRRPSNLDELLMPVLRRKSQVEKLEPADNAGLDLARAVSVSQVLLQDERLSSRFAILPYSGAQLVNVNDSLVLSGIGGDVKERRRIEIRLRKSDRVGLPIAGPTPRLAPPKPKTATVPSPEPTLPTTSEADTALVQPKPQPPSAETIKPKPRRETGGVKTPFGWFFQN